VACNHRRNAYDWTARLAAIAAAAEQIKARSFTIDGEAVALGPDGLSRFEELSRREGPNHDLRLRLDEHDGEDLRSLAFLDRKAARARLLGSVDGGILLNEHTNEDGAAVFAHACRLGAEGIVSKRSTAHIDPVLVRSGSRSAIPPASPCSGSEARRGIDEP
jgi:bifunctional non-homologous end joining protein LigD